MKVEVELRHQKQLGVLRGWLDGRGCYTAPDALEFTRDLEQGVRKDGRTPKFHHQLSIARLVSTLYPHLEHPKWTVAAAFLHDVLEDHSREVTREALTARFGPEISDAVWRLSKKYGGTTKTRESYYGGIAKCPMASVVKLADRAHNLQTMEGVFSQEKQRKYLEEVDQYYWPMIRTSRRAFPRQYPAYENLKILLRCQVRLIRHIHDAQGE
jgi:(p)ppGpp synthase/HD superfamily hydrolase